MIVELAIISLLYLGALFWLGAGNRWQWAIPVSSPPLLLLVLVLRETATFPDAPTGLEPFVIASMLIAFAVGWVSFGAGNLIGRRRRQRIEQVSE
jgi:hypothetical protein